MRQVREFLLVVAAVVGCALVLPGCDGSRLRLGPASWRLQPAEKTDMTSKDYVGCIPDVLFILDRTLRMTAERTEAMQAAINEFLTTMKLDRFQYIETPNRLGGPLSGFSTVEKQKLSPDGQLPDLKCTVKDGASPFVLDPPQGQGSTDVLTPLQLAADQAKSSPKFVVLVADELNNRHVAGVTTGAKYLEAWDSAVEAITRGGGAFRWLQTGSYDPAAKLEKYANPPKPRSPDRGDWNSFIGAYKTILGRSYVVKADTPAAAFQQMLQRMETDVYFASASGDLKEGEKARLIAKARCCIGKVAVSCHTSKCGKENVNRDLRKARCSQVDRALSRSGGIMNSDITTEFEKNVYKCEQQGDGCADEATSDCAQLNRRATISCSYVPIIKTAPKKGG